MLDVYILLGWTVCTRSTLHLGCRPDAPGFDRYAYLLFYPLCSIMSEAACTMVLRPPRRSHPGSRTGLRLVATALGWAGM
eukprot:COSAG02_NODE_161_length_32629_cov_10.363142_14_plen_80_part_00